MIRFLNERFGRLFAQANRSIVLGEATIKIPRGLAGVIGLFNEKHGRATAITAGIVLVIGLAAIPPVPHASTRSGVQSNHLPLAGTKRGLEREETELQNIQQRIDALAARINQIDGSYYSGYMPYEVQEEREQLVVEHNSLVDDFEARRISFNARVDEYNRRLRRR